jgi:carbamoyl-phosphate synthase large subunit
MKSNQVTIAVTGVGSALGQSIVRAALASERHYRVIGMDVTDEDRAIFPDLPYRKSTHIRSPQYQADLENILIGEQVDLIFLGSEREMLGVSHFVAPIEKRTGARFALSEKGPLRIGMDKLLTAEFLREAGLPYPRTKMLQGDWKEISDFAKEIGYPCLVKARRSGQPIVIRSDEDLAYHFHRYENSVLQEFLGEDGAQEYTVGLFHTKEYGVIDTYCMVRLLRYGLTWRGKYEKNVEVETICRRAVEILKPLGSINAQLRYHHGIPVIHELNMRCSSTTVFRALSGWNEIDMAVDYFIYHRKPQVPIVRPGIAIRYFQETWLPNEP